MYAVGTSAYELHESALNFVDELTKEGGGDPLQLFHYFSNMLVNIAGVSYGVTGIAGGISMFDGITSSGGSQVKPKQQSETSIIENESGRGKTYYHVTTAESAQKIMDSGELGVRGNNWESRVYAWTQQPTKRQASIAGVGKNSQTVLKFSTTASFEPDVGNSSKSISNIVVQTSDGQRVPINITDIEIVGFKKEWWQFWKKSN